MPVSGGHDLYLEESGNPDGIPVLYIHGGPGSFCDKHARRFFNPNCYRIIIFDQRGCGRSTPPASIENNTTYDLIKDIETIREFAKVEKLMLFGGSWGATLALLYAIYHPDRVLGIILRGVWLARSRDIEWLYECGANNVFPDFWADFMRVLDDTTPRDAHSIIEEYHYRLVGADELASMSAAKAWCSWNGHCTTLRPSQDILDRISDPHRAMTKALISSHYLMNNLFIEENAILSCSDNFKYIPGIIVHGRYDMIAPLENAVSLQESWPTAQLNIIRDAGHSVKEAGIGDALVRATNEMSKLFMKDFNIDESS